MRWITDFLFGEEATTSVEYAFMLVMILGTVIGAVGALGGHAEGMWGGIQADLEENGF